MKTVLITGTSNGLGALIALELLQYGYFKVIGVDIEGSNERLTHVVDYTHYKCDITNEAEVSALAILISGPIDILINNAGTNYINWLKDTPMDMYDKVFSVNAKSIFLMAKYFQDDITETKGTICNIVSNAAYTPMTNSIAYNGSKGAAHIMTLQLARELRFHEGVTVFGFSPNKLKGTKMSKYIEGTVCELRGWTEEEAEGYQLASLPAGEETDPQTFAEFIAFLLSTKQRHKYLAGTMIPYGK